MTKQNKPLPPKRPRVSIKVKIWLSILFTAVAAILAASGLLVISMNDYYVRVRRDSFGSLLTSISSTFDARGTMSGLEELQQVAGRSHLCVVVESNGLRRGLEGLPFNCYIHKNGMGETETMDQYLDLGWTQDSQIQIRSVNDPDNKTDYFVGTVQGTDGWGIPYAAVVTQVLDSSSAAVAAVRSQLLYISLGVSVFATLIAFWVSRSLTKPLLQVTKATRMIADGSLDVMVDVKSKDEIGDLAANFNRMSREISRVNVLQRELVANISHDMRTPLTMIRGYAETIKDITGNDPEERNRQLDIIVDESNRLSKLVSNVMELSLMQAGQSKLNLGNFDVTEKAQDILGRFRLLEQTSGFEFLLEAAAGYPVVGDEVRVEQVLYNLINNAVNHIGEEKRIMVRIYPFEGEIRIEVADTGTGIRQEDLPLIWDRYYKPYKKTGREMGTGLGLSIVKAILVNHHSRFGVVSTLGVGSTFWFTLRSAPPSREP